MTGNTLIDCSPDGEAFPDDERITRFECEIEDESDEIVKYWTKEEIEAVEKRAEEIMTWFCAEEEEYDEFKE